MNIMKYDEKIARSLHDQINCIGVTENAVFPKEKEKENYQPRTLVDETLEYIDPTPNIYTLFIQFNQKFFWNVLLPVQVKWSPRMTSCAGVCSFHPRNRECIISLSNPLLKLRPRKDLIETLLHEMIHAYLFLTNDNRDRDGHGPVFQSHMRRINKEAGTNITIYHTFHDEVKLYQQHWWRCNGPCQKRAPFFGTVRRAMNRAPGPNDFWWSDHQRTCGGQFIKIKEPEKPQKVKKKNETKGRTNITGVPKTPEKNSLLNWVKKTDNNTAASKSNVVPKKSSQPQTNKNNTKSKTVPHVQTDLKKLGNSTNNVHGWGTSGPNNNSNIKSGNSSGIRHKVPPPNSSTNKTNWNNDKNYAVSNFQTDLKKLGNSTNNVHGWGTGGPDSTSGSNSTPNSNSKMPPSNSSTSTIPRLSFSGTLGGSNTGRSNLLDKYSNTITSSIPSKSSTVPFNLSKNNVNKVSVQSPSQINLVNNTIKTVQCPNCNKNTDESKINEHLDMCLENTAESEIIPDTSKKRKSEDNYSASNKMFKNERASSSSKVECPLCSKKLLPETFNDHLENCLQNGFEHESEKVEDDVVSVHDSSSSSVNLHDSPHFCLICEKALEPNMTLNDHLEECVASVFDESNNETSDNVEQISEIDNIKALEPENKIELDKYPCPICMTLIKEPLMNDHLDICLPKSE